MDKRSLFFIFALSVGLFFFNHLFDKPLPPKETAIQTPIVTTEEQVTALPSQVEESQEELYVLENAFTQVVVSSLGGAVAEINLPFQSQANESSLVLPIGFDKKMERNYPYNDHFPEKGYWLYKNGERLFVNQGEVGGYYPLLRRSVIGKKGESSYPLSPRYFAFNIVSEGQEELYSKVYQVTSFSENSITLSTTDSHRKITKTFTLATDKTPYCLDVEVKVEGDAKGLWLTTGLPEVELVSNQFTPALKYLIPRNGKNQPETLSLPKGTTTYSSISPSWISNSNGFFGIMVEPLSDIGSGFKTSTIEGTLAATRLTLIDAAYDLYPVDKYPAYEMQLPLKMATTTPLHFRVFTGPYQSSLLKDLDYTISLEEKNPNFASVISLQGWFTFISEPFSKLLFLLMKLFYQVTHSWGCSIILLTLALRIMLYPLNEWSIKSTLRMQQVAPQISAIQDKHKKDPKKAQMEILRLYKEKGINPMTGCLPLLIQIPFLIGMFDLLKSTFDLRGASFLIPAWISNLTAPDVVFSWSYPIFFFGTSFHLLPILLGVVMYVQQKNSQAAKATQNLTDAQRQQKFMGNIMVVVFTVISYHFPSGLNIYWLSSMLLQILQQWYASRQAKNKLPTVL
ncbi:MAG: membrane protein insertase YidC [Chlamydiae bacterium]|nr:membrane protein insertase YidC [Chlamydiota bacterium]